jgi:hypothetical protein
MRVSVAAVPLSPGEAMMVWPIYLGYFCIGVLLMNSVPHIVQGASGNRFQTPFARPRGIGESSAIVNVIWGLANVAAAGALLHALGLPQQSSPWGPCVAAWLGALAIGLFLASHFAKVRSDAPRP